MKSRILLFICTLICIKMEAQTVAGSSWKARKIGDTYVVSVADKSSLVDALTDFTQKAHIETASITGIGAVNEATLRFFDPTTRKYVDKVFNEQMEIASLTGNISGKDGSPYLHIHVTLGRSDYSALAGHLLDARIRGAGEFYIHAYPAAINRKFSEEIGLNLYDLE